MIMPLLGLFRIVFQYNKIRLYQKRIIAQASLIIQMKYPRRIFSLFLLMIIRSKKVYRFIPELSRTYTFGDN